MRTFEIELHKVRVTARTRKEAQQEVAEALRPMMMDSEGRPFPSVKSMVEIRRHV